MIWKLLLCPWRVLRIWRSKDDEPIVIMTDEEWARLWATAPHPP